MRGHEVGEPGTGEPGTGEHASRDGEPRPAHDKTGFAAPRRGITAGQVMARVTLLPPVLLMAWLLPSLPLLLAGQFTVGLMLALSVPIAIVLIAAVVVFAPAPSAHRRTPWWTVAALPSIAAGFGVWQAVMHSQQVIVRRDPASYLQFGYWIARHGSLPIPQLRSAFGGSVPGLGFASLGFYQHGTAIVPQFMAGLPITLAAAFWSNGVQLAVLIPPVIGACAVLTFGGLVGRLCGPRWAPLGALVLALSLPEQYTSRSSFSEPLAQILLFGGFCLVTDALLLGPRRRATAARGGAATADAPSGGTASKDAAAAAGGATAGATAPMPAAPMPAAPMPAAPMPAAPMPAARTSGHARGVPAAGATAQVAAALAAAAAPAVGAVQERMRRSAWVMAALGGIAFGLSILVRIDGISDILPVILFCGVLQAARRTIALPLAAGLVLGAAYGLADGYILSRPYLNSLSSQLRPLGYAAAGFAVLTALLVLVSRRRRLPQLSRGRWRLVPDIAAMAVVLIMIGFAIRPLFQTVRGETNPVTIAFIAEVQKLAHLPIDPHRTYAEDSLYWVIWYIGLPTVLLGTFGAALLARKFLRGSVLVWGLPVMVIGWSVVTTLWKPGIVPDQPWASRRLVPIVLPGLVLFAVWTCAWLVTRARARGAGPVAQRGVAACCAVALLLPTAVTSLGLGVGHAPGGGIKIVADGLGFKRTDTGEIAVVNELCRGIGPHAAVVIVDSLTADRFTQIVRGMCGTPAARMDAPTPAAVARVMAGIRRAGRRPVLLAGSAAQLAPYGGAVRRVVYHATRQDEHRLTQPPTTTWRILYQVWMSGPGQQPLP